MFANNNKPHFDSPNMPAQIIDGKEVSKAVRAQVKMDVEKFKQETGKVPKLVVVLVGEDPASKFYVRSKERASEEVGIDHETIRLPEQTSQEVLDGLIDKLNADPECTGILVQSPLPGDLDEDSIIERIDPKKDVDGFHPENMGRLVIGLDCLVSNTPAGIIELLRHYDLNTAGKHVVVVGRSNIVGKPVSNLFIQKGEFADATVTVCHSRTKDLGEFTRQADILVAAVGRAGIITGDMVKEGVIAIDVGINRVDDPEAKRGYRIVGDMDFDSVAKKASHISPVPGGVGLMTVAMLMKNTLKAARMQL